MKRKRKRPGPAPRPVDWQQARTYFDKGGSLAFTARMSGLSRCQFRRRMRTAGLANPRSRPFGKAKGEATE